MTKEQQSLLHIMRDYLHGEPTVLCEHIDYSMLQSYAEKHEVSTILDRQCRRQLPVEVENALKSKVAASLFAYANREQLRKQLERKFQDNGLKYFIVKGPRIAQFYPYPMDRSMGDIDFTMRDGDREIAASFLEEQGFTCTARSFYEWQYFKKEYEIELHNALVYEENINKSEITAYFNDFWKYVHNGELDWNFHFLYIVLHLRKHFMNVGVGLRQFFDIAVLCQRKKDFDWIWIQNELSKLELLQFTETVFALNHEWFGVAPPWQVDSLKKEFVDDAADRIFRSGVFGFADEQNLGKATENALVNSNLPYPLRKLKVLLKKAFPPYEVMRYYPWCSFVNKSKLLLPIAWFARWIYGMTQNRAVWKKSAEEISVDRSEIEKREREFARWGL